MNDAEIAPSPSRARTKLGILSAALYASPPILRPKYRANAHVRRRPKMRLTMIPAATSAAARPAVATTGVDPGGVPAASVPGRLASLTTTRPERHARRHATPSRWPFPPRSADRRAPAPRHASARPTPARTARATG